MNIQFDEKARNALVTLLNDSNNNYIRLRVASVGCGKPAYEIYTDILRDNDILINLRGIDFVINIKDKIMCNNTEIKYNKDVYNNGFYVRSI